MYKACLDKCRFHTRVECAHIRIEIVHHGSSFIWMLLLIMSESAGEERRLFQYPSIHNIFLQGIFCNIFLKKITLGIPFYHEPKPSNGASLAARRPKSELARCLGCLSVTAIVRPSFFRGLVSAGFTQLAPLSRVKHGLTLGITCRQQYRTKHRIISELDRRTIRTKNHFSVGGQVHPFVLSRSLPFLIIFTIS